MPISTDTTWAAKGDLIVATGNDAASILTVTTTAGKTLVKDSAATTGLKWSSPWYNALAPTGAIAESTPRQMVNGDSMTTLATGRMKLTGIYLPKDTTITSITFISGGGPAIDPLNQWFALYDSSRNLLRQTTDDTTSAWAASTVKTLNLTSTYTTTSAGMFYAGVCVKASTVPSLTGNSVQGSSTAFINLSPVLTGLTSDTGLTDTAPNPAGTITASVNVAYCYVS